MRARNRSASLDPSPCKATARATLRLHFFGGDVKYATWRLHMTLDTDRIEKKIVLRASRKRVWRALTDTTEFGNWFGMKFDGPFKAGAVMRGTITPTKVDADVARLQKEFDGTPFEITVDRIEPERLFSFRWH